MCLIARSWGFFIGCLCFLVGVRVGSPAMMISMFLGKFDAILFGVMSVGSSVKILPHWFMAVSGSCAGFGDVVM